MISPSVSRSWLKPLVLWGVTVIVVVGGLLLLEHDRNGSIIRASYESQGGSTEQSVFPLYENSVAHSVHGEVIFNAATATESQYQLTWYGCMTALALNGHAVTLTEQERCQDMRGSVIQFAPFFHAGSNTLSLTLEVHPFGGELISFASMRPSIRNPETLLHALLLLVLFGIFCGWALRATLAARSSSDKLLGWTFLVGGLLRVGLTLVTPVGSRTPDVMGHLEYLRHVAEHMTIPAAQAGWETFQPPLFYFIGGAWMRALALLQSRAMNVDDVQILALLFGLGALAIGIVCIRWLFDKHPRDAVACAFLFAVFPGLIFFAYRPSNDALLQLLAFAFFAGLLAWRREAKPVQWIAICAVICAGMLTKSSALVWIPIALAVLAVQPRYSVRKKLRRAAELAVIVLVCCGWYYVLRFGLEKETNFVGNMQHLPDAMRVPDTLRHLLTFRLPTIIFRPYADSSMSFPEYFFTSLHFGSFHYPELVTQCAQWVIAGAIGITLLAGYGLLRLHRKNPLHDVALLTCAFLLFSQAVYRIVYPYSYNQDARFSPLLGLVLVYGCVRGMRLLPPRMQPAAEAIVMTQMLFYTVCAVLMFTQS